MIYKHRTLSKDSNDSDVYIDVEFSGTVILNQRGDVHNDMVVIKLDDIPRVIETLQEVLKEKSNASPNY